MISFAYTGQSRWEQYEEFTKTLSTKYPNYEIVLVEADGGYRFQKPTLIIAIERILKR